MEVLLSSDEAEISKLSVNFWNPTTGSKLLSLRGPPALPKSLTLIRDEGVLVVEAGKPFIHIWQTGHSLQSSRRILCPRKPGSLTMTPDGTFLVVAMDEKIYIWQVATGRIVTVINSAHYRPVTVLKFTDDGSYLISGGQDGLVLVWQLLSLVSGHSILPKYSWTEHSAEVTGIHIGFGGGTKASVFTVGLDRTAKIYSLLTGTLLLSVSYPVGLTTIVADTGEFSFFVGSVNGTIYQMKLQSAPRSIEHHITSDVMADSVMKKHKEMITAMSISADGRTLASGDTEGLILLWDTDTKQAIKTIVGGKAKVTNLLFWLGNPENLKGGKKPQVIFPDVPKLIEQSDDRNELDQVVLVWNRHDRNTGMGQPGELTSDATTIQLARLKAELARSQKINARLHEFCLEQVLSQAASKPKPLRKVKGSKVIKRRQMEEDDVTIDIDLEGEESISVPSTSTSEKKSSVSNKKKKKSTSVSLSVKVKGHRHKKENMAKKLKTTERKRRQK